MTAYFCQNGLRAYEETDTFTRFNAGGRGWWAGNKNAAIVAAYLINRFDREVEKVVFPGEEYDDWSHAWRAVRGQTSGYSNHAGSWAWDINSTRHPRGVAVSKNLSVHQIALIHNIIYDINKMSGGTLIRWGGDYTKSPVDAMHFEIIGSLAMLEKAADTIKNKEDDVTETELKNAIRAVLQEKLVPNVDSTGKETGKMSLIRAADLGDQKADFTKAAVRRLETMAIAQNKVLTAIAANSPQAIKDATDEFVAKVKAELAEIDVKVSLGTDGAA